MSQEGASLRAQLRKRATDGLQSSLSSAEAAANSLRSSRKQGRSTRDATYGMLLANLARTTDRPEGEGASDDGDAVAGGTADIPPPTRAEAARRARYAARRRALGEYWREGALTRAVLLLRRRRGSAGEQQRCVSLCAWSFAITGMLVCIGFLVAEFVNSRASPALVSRVEERDLLPLPVVTFCAALPGLPAFYNFPRRGFPGGALFGARLFSDAGTGEQLRWPATHTSGRVKLTALGPPERCERQLSTFSFAHVGKRASGAAACHACFQVGRGAPINISRASHNGSRAAVQVEFSLAKEVAFCIVPHFGSNVFLTRGMRHTIKLHGRALAARGILVLRGTSDLMFAIDNAFDGLRRAGDVDGYNLALRNFVCNVYFASGYFFPKPSFVDVRYRYDIDTDFWDEIGSGPYHKLKPFKRASSFKPVGVSQNQSKSVNVKSELSDLRYEVNLAHTLLVFAKDASLGLSPEYQDTIGTVVRLQPRTFLFSRVEDDDRVMYSNYQPQGSAFFRFMQGRFYVFKASLDLLDFRVEIKSKQPSISITELISDIFQYASLFTGVCVYSILVGPAKWYIKRSRAKREEAAAAAGAV